MKEKLQALKTLGFNYVTRDMGGKLIAWMDKPYRVVYCTQEKEKEAREKYGEDAEIEIVKNHEELDEAKMDNGYCKKYCFFGVPDIDLECKAFGYGHFELYDPYNDFAEIKWENSPVEIK